MSVRPRDPAGDFKPRHRLDIVCRHLAKTAAVLAKRFTENAWEVACRPLIDGTLVFAFTKSTDRISVVWRDEAGGDVPELPGSLSIEGKAPGDAENRLFRAVALTLATALKKTDYAFLTPLAPADREPGFEETARILSENILGAGRTGWGEARLVSMEMERGRLLLRFEHPGGPSLFSLRKTHPDAAQKVAAWPKGRALLRRRAVSLFSETESDRAGETTEVLGKILGFYLTRVVPRALETVENANSEGTEKRSPDIPKGKFEADGAENGATFFDLPPGESWPLFWAPSMLDLATQGNLQTTRPVSVIFHAPRNCFTFHPALVRHTQPLFQYPWWTPDVSRADLHVTDIQDADVLEDGGEADFADLMARLAKDETRPLLVNHACLPDLMGQDIAALERRIRTKGSAPILRPFPCRSGAHPEEQISDYLRELRRFMEDAPRSERPSINLVGYELARDTDELAALLEDLGVAVNARILPNVDLERTRAYRKAWVQVFRPNALMRPAYEAVFHDLEPVSCFADAPYGIEGARKWLESIITALGLDTDWERDWKVHAEPFREEMERMRERAGRCRLGFVLVPGLLRRFLRPECNFGIPFIDFLCELGFRIAIGLFIPPEDGKNRSAWIEAARRELDPLSKYSELIEISCFHDRDGLSVWLSDSDLHAVYSDYSHDARLETVGKPQFSLKDLEKGAAGALRTLRRLLQRCEMPYYRELADMNRKAGDE